MEQTRRKNFYTNVSVSAIQRIVNLFTSFINRTIFIYTLGMAYLGVGGLFTDILTIFSLAELGIGDAITYHLYKPLVTDDMEEVKSLMNFYKICYRIIGCVILLAGILLLPFLKNIITDVDDAIHVNIYVVYLLYLMNTVTSYLFFAYKRTLLSAVQKAYKSQVIDVIYSVISECVLAVVLLIYHNFIVYLAVKIGGDIAKNFVLSREIDKWFPFLKEKDCKKFSKEKIKEISKNIYAVFVGKISGTIFTSTDSIIISKFISTVVVGLTDNYRMIMKNIVSLAGIVTGAMLPAVGDMAARHTREECRVRFTNYNFLCFWVYSFFSVCMVHTFNPFIEAWIGGDKILSQMTVIVLVLNFWLDLILQMVYLFRAAYGLYRHGEYLQLIGAGINIFLSIELIPIMGVTGVFLATTITNLPTFLYPYYLFRYGFQSSPLKYYANLIGQFLSLVLAYMISGYFCSMISLDGYLGFVCKGLICAIFTNLLFFLLYSRTEEYKFVKTEISRLVNRILHRG